MEKCFAMGQQCRALEKPAICKGCTFYRTRHEQKASLETAWERIRQLPVLMQQYFADAYYAGKMPWYDETEV